MQANRSLPDRAAPGEAAPSLRGELFAIAMHAVFPLALRRIQDGWQRIAATGELLDTPSG